MHSLRLLPASLFLTAALVLSVADHASAGHPGAHFAGPCYGGYSSHCGFGYGGGLGNYGYNGLYGGGYWGGSYLGGGYLGGFYGFGDPGVTNITNNYNNNYYYPPPAMPATQPPAAPGPGRIPLPPPTPTAAITVATLDINVSADADVYVQDVKMPPGGTTRHFVTPDLDPLRNYSYEIRATWNFNGRDVSLTQRVSVRAGDQKGVTFFRPPVPAEAGAQAGR